MSSADETRDRVAYLVYALYQHANTSVREFAHRSGLHPGDTLAIRAMQRILSTPSTVSDLGNHLELTSASATHLVDRLEDAGLARRERDTIDRRRVFVRPTPSMAQLGDQIMGGVASRLRDTLRSADPRTLRTVERFLSDVLGPESLDPPGRHSTLDIKRIDSY